MKNSSSPVVGGKRRNRFKVEALESRQLLAFIGGSGKSAGDNIVFQGNTYDQVLMTGQSVTVKADAGQITRVSFQDADGDIVFAEFGGGADAALTVNLENFSGPAPAAKYNQPGVNYVTGNASFVISNPDSGTYFSVYSLGTDPNRINTLAIPVKGTFTGPNDGIANVKSISVLSNTGTASTSMGGINAANAIFAGSTGNVGITARNVDIQQFVYVGDIKADAGAVPTLLFGQRSQFNVVTVTGGNLVQPNGQPILVTEDNAGVLTTTAFQGVTSQAGQKSTFATDPTGAALQTQAIKATYRDAQNAFVNYIEETAFVTGAQNVNLTGMSQAALDAFFDEKTFTGKVTFTGTLTPDRVINAESFRGGVEFVNDLNGNVLVNKSIIGGLTVDGNVGASAQVLVGSNGRVASTNQGAQLDTIDNLTVKGNVLTGAVIGSETIQAVNITGDLGGLITTDVYGGATNGDTTASNGPLTVANGAPVFGFNSPNFVGAQQAIEFTGAIGAVTIGGSITDGGAIEGVQGIGNVLVGKDIIGGTAAGTAVAKFSTASNAFNSPNGNALQTGRFITSNIGTITVAGDVNLGVSNAVVNGQVANNGPADAGSQLIRINGNGIYGNITVSGGGTQGTLDGTNYNDFGQINIVGSLGPGQTTTGTITVTDNADLHFNGVQIRGNLATGTINPASIIGNISFTNSATAGAKIVTLGETTFAPNIANVTFAGNTAVSIGPSAIAAPAFVGTGGFAAVSPTGLTSNIGNIALSAVTVTLNATNGFTSEANIGTVNVTATSRAIFSDNFSSGTIGAATVTAPLVTVNSLAADAQNNAAFDADILLTSLTVNTGQFSTNPGNGDLTFTVPRANNTGTILLGATALQVNAASRLVSSSSTGAITVNGDTNAQGSLIIGNDGTSKLDAIGAVTFNGQVYGRPGILTVGGSSIASITVNADLVSSDDPNFDPTLSAVAVKDFSALATNNGNATTGARETVATTGANLSSYTIGNVTVTSTLRDPATGTQAPFTNTSLFAGVNQIAGLGGIGNVNITGGSNGPVQQSRMFFNGASGLNGVNAGAPTMAATDKLFITAGLATLNTASRAVDFDGDTNFATNADETNGNFSAGAANIGTVSISALSSNGPTQNFAGTTQVTTLGTGFGYGQGDPTVDTQVDLISGGGTNNGAGLTILAGIVTTTDKGSAFNAGARQFARIDNQLTSTVGNIQVQSIRGTLLADIVPANTANTPATPGGNLAAFTGSGIITASGTGTVQVTNPGLSGDVGNASAGPASYYILGDANNTTDDQIENYDQLLVFRAVNLA